MGACCSFPKSGSKSLEFSDFDCTSYKPLPNYEPLGLARSRTTTNEELLKPSSRSSESRIRAFSENFSGSTKRTSEERHVLVTDTCELLKFSKPKAISLRSKNLDDGSAQLLAGALSQNVSITSLNLAQNWIADEGAQALCNKLASNLRCSLLLLDLSSNRIGNVGGLAIADFIIANSRLETLKLSDNLIGPTGGSAIGTSLIYNTSIQTLILNENPITDTGIRSFSSALLQNNTLQNLSLSGTEITCIGVQSFACNASTASPIRLKSLCVSHNNLGDEGIQAISQLIYATQTLRNLKVANTCMSDEGALDLVTALGCNTSLACLDVLAGNSVSDGGQMLAKAFLLRYKRCLVDLSPLDIDLATLITDYLDFSGELDYQTYIFVDNPAPQRRVLPRPGSRAKSQYMALPKSDPTPVNNQLSRAIQSGAFDVAVTF